MAKIAAENLANPPACVDSATTAQPHPPLFAGKITPHAFCQVGHKVVCNSKGETHLPLANCLTVFGVIRIMGKQPVPWRTFVKNEICLLSCILTLLLAIPSCSSGPRGRIILDTSTSDKPDWVDSDRLSWKEEKNIFFKGTYAVRGDERTNGCIDLAKLGVKEAVITENSGRTQRCAGFRPGFDSRRCGNYFLPTRARHAIKVPSQDCVLLRPIGKNTLWPIATNAFPALSSVASAKRSLPEPKKNVLNKITPVPIPNSKRRLPTSKSSFFEE